MPNITVGYWCFHLEKKSLPPFDYHGALHRDSEHSEKEALYYELMNSSPFLMFTHWPCKGCATCNTEWEPATSFLFCLILCMFSSLSFPEKIFTSQLKVN